jgi:hypothetical protein
MGRRKIVKGNIASIVRILTSLYFFMYTNFDLLASSPKNFATFSKILLATLTSRLYPAFWSLDIKIYFIFPGFPKNEKGTNGKKARIYLLLLNCT